MNATIREEGTTKVAKLAAKLTNEALCLAWMATEGKPVTQELAIVRGWIQSELHNRLGDDLFDEWLVDVDDNGDGVNPLAYFERKTAVKGFLRCWTCNQPATHTLTREGSNTLHACDNCTRIDRAEAESRGWTITPITGKETRMAKNETVATFTIDGRDYDVIRIGMDPKHSSWNVLGAFPKHTAAELAMPDTVRPPVSPVYAARAEGVGGWLVHDEMNRKILGSATTYEDIARIAAQDPHRPLV